MARKKIDPSPQELWQQAEQIRMAWSFRERQKRDVRPRRRKPVYTLADVLAAGREPDHDNQGDER